MFSESKSSLSFFVMKYRDVSSGMKCSLFGFMDCGRFLLSRWNRWTQDTWREAGSGWEEGHGPGRRLQNRSVCYTQKRDNRPLSGLNTCRRQDARRVFTIYRHTDSFLAGDSTPNRGDQPEMPNERPVSSV